jgi:hypothetical protein
MALAGLRFSFFPVSDRGTVGECCNPTHFDKFEQHRTMENGTNCCMADRRVVLLLFLASMDHDVRDMIEQFLQHAEQVVDIYSYLADTASAGEDKTWHDFLLRRAAEEERRICILHMMLNNDLNKASSLLIETIEHAEQLNQIQKSSKARPPPEIDIR